MTISAVQEHLNGSGDPAALPGAAEAAANGYSAAGAHPMDIRHESRPGSHDAYMAMVRSMVDREMRSLGSYIQSGYYQASPRLRSLVTRIYHLALWQLKAPAGLMNHRRTELVRERTALQEMLKGFGKPQDPEDVRQSMSEEDGEALYRTSLVYGTDTLQRFTSSSWIVPLTFRDAYDRLDEISALIRSLTAQIQDAQRKGEYWDCGPIIEYFRTPLKDRGDIDLMAVAPPFLLKLQVYVDISVADAWRHQAQRITSQTADGDQSFAPQQDADPRPNKKRSLFGRFGGR